MLSTWLQTLNCLRFVRGYWYGKIPSSSFVARQGGYESDMFRFEWKGDDTEPISLQDYHAAFLTSPLFQIELFLLSAVQGSSREKMTNASYLAAVAQGKEKSVGPWTTHATDGECDAEFSSSSSAGKSVTRIMQCHIHGAYFKKGQSDV